MSCLLLVVHGVHGSVGLSIRGEADESESTAAVGVMVLDDNLSLVSTSIMMENFHCSAKHG